MNSPMMTLVPGAIEAHGDDRRGRNFCALEEGRHVIGATDSTERKPSY
jgi:hypothetical protein